MRMFGLSCASVIALVTTAVASDVTRPHTAMIHCGANTFALKTYFGQDSAFHLGIISQDLSVVPEKRIDIKAFSLGLSKGLLRAEITGWLCVKGGNQHVLVLAYSCASDAGDGCGGSKEWTHFVSPQGTILDPGFRPGDDRTQPLLKSLGLDQQMRDGLSLQEVLE